MSQKWTSDRDELCAEGYLQGIGCPRCEAVSDWFVGRMVEWSVTVAVVLPTLVWSLG